MSVAFCALAPIVEPMKALAGGIPHGDTVRTSGADIMKKARSSFAGPGQVMQGSL